MSRGVNVNHELLESLRIACKERSVVSVESIVLAAIVERAARESRSHAQNQKDKAAALATRKLLAERFPTTFKGFGEPKLPLKIGIHLDVIAALPDVNRRKIRAALWDYCEGWTYKRELVAGAARYGLDGLPAGVVTAKEAEVEAYPRTELMNQLREARDRIDAQAVEIARLRGEQRVAA